MKSIILISMVLLAIPAASYGQQGPSGRFGTLEVERDEDGSGHRLSVNGKEILQLQGQMVEIRGVLRGRGKDHFIVVNYSGGTACPALITIVELRESGRSGISEEFGSCSDIIKAKLVSGRVIIEMPAHIPHPDLLPKRELLKRRAMKEVYTWYEGKLSKRTLPR